MELLTLYHVFRKSDFEVWRPCLPEQQQYVPTSFPTCGARTGRARPRAVSHREQAASQSHCQRDQEDIHRWRREILRLLPKQPTARNSCPKYDYSAICGSPVRRECQPVDSKRSTCPPSPTCIAKTVMRIQLWTMPYNVRITDSRGSEARERIHVRQ